MSNKTLIELAYDFLEKSNHSETFESIWKNIISQKNISELDQNELVSTLYSDLVLDNRFALTSDGNWGLRKNLKKEDIKRQYDYIDNIDDTEFMKNFTQEFTNFEKEDYTDINSLDDYNDDEDISLETFDEKIISRRKDSLSNDYYDDEDEKY